MRERWWGGSGRRVPELAVEGDPAVPAGEALVLDGVDDLQAMAAAFAEARPGDVVLVAGKGHETTQTIGRTVMPFDDREVARSLLAAGGARA